MGNFSGKATYQALGGSLSVLSGWGNKAWKLSRSKSNSPEYFQGQFLLCIGEVLPPQTELIGACDFEEINSSHAVAGVSVWSEPSGRSMSV
jgi:hypothetical protein